MKVLNPATMRQKEIRVSKVSNLIILETHANCDVYRCSTCQILIKQISEGQSMASRCSFDKGFDGGCI